MFGILNIKDLNEEKSLSAKDYLRSEDYITCKKCRRVIPISKVVDGYNCKHGKDEN